MKTSRILFSLAMVGMLSLAAVAWAGPGHNTEGHGGPGTHMGMMKNGGHGGQMMGGGMGMSGAAWDALTPEQRDRYSSLRDAYAEKVEPMRSDMWAKHTELEALSNNPKVEPSYITKLVQDMKELGAKMRAERKIFADQVEKELGIRPFHRGFGDCPGGNCGEAPVN